MLHLIGPSASLSAPPSTSSSTPHAFSSFLLQTSARSAVTSLCNNSCNNWSARDSEGRWWRDKTLKPRHNVCRRGLVRASIRRVSDLLVSLCWKSDSVSSFNHDESFIASHIAVMVFSIVVVIILGRHRQGTSRPGAVVGGSRFMSALTLHHVCLVQAAPAGVRVLFAAG